MASGFGYRTDPFTKARKMHEGMDFTAKIGTQFMQLATVSAQADNRASGYGNHIVIRHGYGYETLYGHLSKYNSKAGQK
jgi:murein DD-endopeptidase MepM/ murein hydrolase activator NlpD